MPTFTVLALIFLYGGHCFSVWLPSKVTQALPNHVSCNAPQHMTMFPDSIIVL